MATPAPKESTAPRQETLEQQPLSGGDAAGYGAVEPPTSGHWSANINRPKMLTPEEIDAKLPKHLAKLCSDWIVQTNQFDEMEDAGSALVCARFLRMFLIFFICTSTLGLCVGFFFKASLAAPMETEQYGSIDAPSVVFCGSPWGTNFLGFSLDGVAEGVLPGNDFTAISTKNFTMSDFNASKGGDSAAFLTGCKIVRLKDVSLKPLGKVAQYTGFETIRLTVNAQTEDGKFNFGFCNGDNLLPQRWSYGSLGSRITGEVMYDQVNVGATDVSEGTPRSILGFSQSGSALVGGKTELEYYFGYFMIRVLSAQAKGISLFSCIAFVLLVAAAVNNCGLFDLFFVEVVPDDEPPPALEPNMLCQVVCGKICSSCRRRKKSQEELMVEEAEEAKDVEDPKEPEPPVPVKMAPVAVPAPKAAAAAAPKAAAVPAAPAAPAAAAAAAAPVEAPAAKGKAKKGK